MSTCTAELGMMRRELETVWLSELLEEAILTKAGRGNLGRNRLWLYCIQWSVICYHCTARVCNLYKKMISSILVHLYISSEDDNNLLLIFVNLFIWHSFGIIIIIIIILYSFINSW